MPKFMLFGEGNAKEQAFCEQSWRTGPRADDLLCCMYGRNYYLERSSRTVRVEGLDEAISLGRATGVETVLMLALEQFEAGRVEAFRSAGFRVVGVPTSAAFLENNKARAKSFMRRHAVASAYSTSFCDAGTAEKFLIENWATRRFVVKASCYLSDVRFSCSVPDTLEEAIDDVRGLADHLGSIDAPRAMVLEERAEGREFSVHVLIDGANYKILPMVRDYKRLLEGDKGPNTAGIGAVAAAIDWDRDLISGLRSRIIEPTIDGLLKEDIDYHFILYIGAMVTRDGPIALEYNVRPGTPEFPALLAVAKTSGLEMFTAAQDGKFGSLDIEWENDEPYSVAVTLTAPGYPFSSLGFGESISGLDDLDDDVWPLVEHMFADPEPTVSNGRVLTLVARGASFQEARERVYRNVDRMRFRGLHTRRDIGDLVALE
ncbi:phosphoribosylamine--glycine ligase [Micromonospora sp. Llam0]|uniref:phosphoribosylamine--glycine ligase n=1 Tax=Micromonospora sp. Llam0 TaxID=2485143 RepID=UPI000F474FAD|nr:phosphoribosylglycinamide synthetase C domain-containing protein [Micromonospora sp. Llam0]ROO62632.1 phosphoribosylamine--glycine ligase [Micromonospora sp. Llam0]